jgi:sporulation protein YlmC with PRC-barrel domain
MIRASGLYGRSVVDLDTAERVGDVDEIIVDTDGPGIAGFVVSCERSLWSMRKRMIVPMETVHAVGPDALTVRSLSRPDSQTAYLDSLPRLSELTGRRMVSFGGRLLGAVEDALIDERDGRIIGYPIERSGPSSWFESIFGLGWKSDRPDYVRADAGLRIGARLIVAPDDAIAPGDELGPALGDNLGPAFDETVQVDQVGVVPSLPAGRTEPEAQAPTEAGAWAAWERTMPASAHDPLMTDEGLGIEPSVKPTADDALYERPAVDPDEDTGLIASAGEARSRPRRRPQAERMR